MPRVVLNNLTSLTIELRFTMSIDEHEDELLTIEYSSVPSWLMHTASLGDIYIRISIPSTPQSSTHKLAKALMTPDVVAELEGLDTTLLSHNPSHITVLMPYVKRNSANLLAEKIPGAFPQALQAGLLRLPSSSSE